MAGPALVRHPGKEVGRCEIKAVAVIAAIGPVQGHIAALGIAVGMGGAVGADDAGPALGVGARE